MFSLNTKIPKLKLILIFVILLANQAAFSQMNQEFFQKNWSTENGLPQNSIRAIAQTPDGYIWLGTLGGLARFDGVKFKVYTTANVPELKFNRIMALTVDSTGRLWIGSEHGEISTFKDGKFSLVDDGRINGNHLINDLFADSSGTIWVSSDENLSRCDENVCQSTEVHSQTHRFRKDSQGNFWIRGGTDLFMVPQGNFTRMYKVVDGVSNFEIGGDNKIAIIKDQELGFYSDGKYSKYKDIPTAWFSAPKFDAAGNLWINSEKALYRFKNSELTKYTFDVDTGVIFFDRENNIWLGLASKGLSELFKSPIENLTLDKFKENNSPNSIATDGKGKVWISTSYGIFQWENGKVALVSAKKDARKLLERGALFYDSYGVLWSGTKSGLVNIQNGVEIPRKDLDWKDAILAQSFFEDGEKNIWYGGDDSGLIKTDRKNIIARYSTTDGLVNNDIHVITADRSGAMWIGTKGGVSRFKDGAFTNYSTQNGLSNDYVRDIYEDQDGAIWIGTYGGGLNRLKDGKISVISTKNGLYDDIVSSILVDDNDNFWMLGNRGIFSVSRQSLNDVADGRVHGVYCNIYNSEDGMLTSEGNGGAQYSGIRTPDGRLWFSMINEVVMINPEVDKSPGPNTIIEEVLIGKSPVEFTDQIDVNADHKEIEINYTGISFRKPNLIQFRYKMDGLDADWTEAGTRRSAYFPFLPAGEYHFQVMAMNAEGVWSDQVSELKIIVHPLFYQTSWFAILLISIAISTLILIFYLLSQIQKRQFIRQKKLQEEFSQSLISIQENERKRIAAEIHDNLGQKLLIIKNWADYCLRQTSDTDKIRNQIGQIGETASDALRQVRALAQGLSPYHLDKAGLTNTIKYMIKQVGDSCPINFRYDIDNVNGILPKEDEINLFRIIQEAVSNIARHSQATKADIVLKVKKNAMYLKIHDNGIGFNQAKDNLHKSGIGLDGIRERARMLKGNLNIRAVPGKFTNITLNIERNLKEDKDE